jgi:hypothetical protein
VLRDRLRVATIARPALVTGRFGTAGYATLSGLLAVPITIATATAPLATAGGHQVSGSYTPVLGDDQAAGD